MNARPVPTLLGALACLLCATALTPLFDGLWWWFAPVAAATAVCVAVSMLARLLRLPVLGQAVLCLLGLAETVSLLSEAKAESLGGVVPTLATLRTLRDLIVAGTEDIAQLAAPVPQRPGLVVLTVVGVYLVVLIVDMLVVALGRPTLAGLPLLGLFAVPGAVLEGGVGIVPFLLGAVGFLLLMLMDGRASTSRWGRAVDGHRATAVRSGSTTLGTRVAVSTLAAAVALPLLIPTLDNHGLLGRGLNSAGGGSGPTTANVLQPIAALRQQLQNQTRVELMRVVSPEAPYLRLTALDLFDGTMFKLQEIRVGSDSRLPDGLPDRPDGVPTRQLSAEITVFDNYTQHLLPVPGLPTSIDGLDGDWRWDDTTATVFATESDTAGAVYRVDASEPVPSAEFLAQDDNASSMPDELRIDTELPPNLDPRIPDLVTSLTADRRNSYEKIVAIEEHLRGPLFTYDLNGAPTNSSTALQTFLFDTRTGYCEQFASAMVVMVRTLGIPARVAIGFTGGTRNATTGAWTVTNKDAHAWPEVWFPQAGWIRFEPTRRDDGATAPPPYSSTAGPATTPPVEATATPPEAAVVPVPVPVPAGEAIPTPVPPTPSPTTSATPTENGGSPIVATAVGVGLALTVVGVLAAPALLRRRTRNRRMARVRSRTAGAAGVHEAWSELVDLATDLGIPLSPSQSPRASATKLGDYLEAPQLAPDDHYSRQIITTTGSPPSRTETLPSDRAIGNPSFRRHQATPAAAGRGFSLAARGHGPPAARKNNDRAAFGPPAGPESGEPRVRAAREALGRLARAEEHARYAPAGLPLHDQVARRLAGDLATATATLWSVSPRGQRFRAIVVPPSLLARLGTTTSETVRAVAQTVGRRLRGRSALGRADDAASAIERPAADSQRVVSGAGR